MIYESVQMEQDAVMQTAMRMCAAARTAPKGRGMDHIAAMVLTGAEKDALADKMAEVAAREYGDKPNFIRRDSGNLKAAQAVVLIGVKRASAGLPFCSYCGFESCAACAEAGGRCAFMFLDLGIAAGSAAGVAARDHVDNRVMFSVGKVVSEMGYPGGENVTWLGIPLSVSGKSPFFDRG